MLTGTFSPQKVSPGFQTFLFGFALLLLTSAVFFQVRDFDFVRLDDNRYISENPHIQQGFTWNAARWALEAGFFRKSAHADYWQPLTFFSRMFDIEFFGLWAGGHHLMNLLYHTINVLLLFAWFLRLSGNKWVSALTAAVFAIHPLQVEAVAWITARKDVLSTLFGLCSLHFYSSYASTSRFQLGNYLLSFIFFFFGITAKPMMAVLPMLFLLLDRYLYQRKNVLKTVFEKIPYFLLSSIASYLYILGQPGNAERLSLHVMIFNAPVVCMRSVLKFFAPINLGVWSIQKGFVPTPNEMGVSVLLIVLFLLLAYIFRKSRPWIACGILWFFVSIGPSLVLPSYGDRFMYVPMIGLLMAFGVTLAGDRAGLSASGRWLSCVYLAILAVLAFYQTKYWRNTFTLLEHSINVTQNNYIAYLNLGVEYDLQGKEDVALEYYLKALVANPQFAEPYYNIGNIEFRHGQNTEAKQQYMQALLYDPTLFGAHANLGTIYFEEGKYEQALTHFFLSLSADESATIYDKIANTYKVMGLRDKAIKYYSKSVALDPGSFDAHYHFAILLIEMENYADAVKQLSESIRIRPSFAKAHYNKAVALSILGRYDEAATSFDRTLELDPQYAGAQEGKVLASSMRSGEV